MKTKRGYSEETLRRLWVKALAARAGGVCEVCHKSEGTQGHHIIKRRARILRWDWHNGVWICTACHQEVEKPWNGAKLWIGLGDKRTNYLETLGRLTFPELKTMAGITADEWRAIEKSTLKDAVAWYGVPKSARVQSDPPYRFSYVERKGLKVLTLVA